MVGMCGGEEVQIQKGERREVSPDAATVHLIGKKLLQEFTHIAAARREQYAFAFFEELRELVNVGGVGADRKRRQSLLDSEVVEKAGKHARVGFGSHG